MIDSLNSKVQKLTQEKDEKIREGLTKADEIDKVKAQAYEEK